MTELNFKLSCYCSDKSDDFISKSFENPANRSYPNRL
jgi:hypothetical protein